MKGMKYHDYIWDLGGTLLDKHDKVYNALKVSTAFAIDQFAPTIEHFLEKYKENEARELEHPALFEGVPALLEEI